MRLTHHPRRAVAGLAVAACALAPGTALAREVDDPALPAYAGSPLANTTSDLPPVVVTRTTPAADGSSETLSLVLSSAALLVSIGGVGFTVRRRATATHPLRTVGGGS
jgi:hypothetical protein